MRLFCAMNTTEKILLHISLIPGVGPATVDILVRTKYESDSLKNIYFATVDDLVQSCGLSLKSAQAIVNGLRDHALLDRELILLEKHGITWVNKSHQLYPELLRHIASAPIGLYYKGEMHNQEVSLAIVGSRDASSYGSRVISMIVPPLIEHGYCIVSGGAQGIDTFAHQAALDAGGRTIVVLGSGLLKPYPGINRRLFDAVVDKGGVLLSPFSLQTSPLPGNFPARNRIISGMSQGCLVVQAAAKSGSLITADFALNQGRHVFAIPGPIDDQRSVGCNDLLKQGAQLVSSASDIVEVMGSQAPVVATSIFSVSKQRGEVIQNSLLSDAKRVIVDACRQPASFDELLEVTGFSLTQLQGELFDLQLGQQIVQNGAGLWEQT